MLDDRNYMRESSFSAYRSATFTLIILNVAVFVVHMLVRRFTSFPFDDYFQFSLRGLGNGYIWQPLTYAFLHAGPLHLLFNLFAIYVFGNEVENALGRRSFLALYISSILAGALFQGVAGLVFGGQFAASVVGASAAAFGLAGAFALLFPDRVLLLFFILPVRARYLIPIMGILILYGLLFPDHVAHAAHLGGLVAGLAFVRYARSWSWSLPRMPRLVRVRRAGTRSDPKGGPWPIKEARSVEEESGEDFLSKEVDPILDKISASGIQSLTERERRILEQARARMARR